jgi:hypothetical protein
MFLSFPVFPLEFQAWGNNLLATAIIAVSLGWHIRHPLAQAAGPQPTGALQPPSS